MYIVCLLRDANMTLHIDLLFLADLPKVDGTAAS